MIRTFDNGISLEATENGLLVRQYDDAYIARRWCLKPPVDELVQTALDSNLRWMIREGHPQMHARWPSGQGRVYLAFSPTRENHWSLAIDTFSEARGDFSFGVFNGKYHSQFAAHGIPFTFEKRNRTAGHMEVAREHVLPAIRQLANFDHSMLYLGRGSASAVGFSTEYDIQRAILFGWQRTPFAPGAKIIGDEVPVDAGQNPRRIDILARDTSTGDWLVIEIKRAEARIEAVRQVEGYLSTLALRDRFLGGPIRGVIVAERISPSVRDAARSVGISAFEISFPLSFRQVA